MWQAVHVCVSLWTHLCVYATVSRDTNQISSAFFTLPDTNSMMTHTRMHTHTNTHTNTHTHKHNVTEGLNYISTQETLSQFTALFSINELEGCTVEFAKTPDTIPLWFPPGLEMWLLTPGQTSEKFLWESSRKTWGLEACQKPFERPNQRNG